MKKIALSTVLASATLLATSLANAQDCPPGSWLCAGLQIGAGVSGGVVIGGPRRGPPPPPPPPPPPATVVQAPTLEFQAGATIVPQPVYVQPSPQQVVIYRQAPVVYTTTYLQPQPVAAPAPAQRQQFGLGAYASGLFLGGGESSRSRPAVGGAGVVVRYRHNPHIASEVTLAGMFGNDYNGDRRAEVPVTVGGVVYFNPQNRFQVYGLLGAGLSFASVQYDAANARVRGMDQASYLYLGGYAGVGAEWQLSRSFALFFDVRGFIRGRVDRDAESNPEFSRVQGTRTQTSNASMGMSGQLGGMFWF